MNKEEFYQLNYQSQFYELIDFIYQEYKHQPYLYYALHTVTNLYEHSEMFSNKLLEELNYFKCCD